MRYLAYAIGEAQRTGRIVLTADPAAGATSWLEPFTTAAARFYERAGFTLVAWHDEPATGRPYAVLRRDP